MEWLCVDRLFVCLCAEELSDRRRRQMLAGRLMQRDRVNDLDGLSHSE